MLADGRMISAIMPMGTTTHWLCSRRDATIPRVISGLMTAPAVFVLMMPFPVTAAAMGRLVSGGGRAIISGARHCHRAFAPRGHAAHPRQFSAAWAAPTPAPCRAPAGMAAPLDTVVADARASSF